MKLKTFGKIMLSCVLLIGLAACSKDKKEEQEAKVDPRDAFVGDYTYEATGRIKMNNIPLLDTISIPLNEKGEAMIAKEGDQSKIIIVAEKDTIRAEVTGNQLRLDSSSVTYTYNKIKLQMMLSNDRATLENKQINWESDILTEGSYNEHKVNGDGHLKIVANKK